MHTEPKLAPKTRHTACRMQFVLNFTANRRGRVWQGCRPRGRVPIHVVEGVSSPYLLLQCLPCLLGNTWPCCEENHPLGHLSSIWHQASSIEWVQQVRQQQREQLQQMGLKLMGECQCGRLRESVLPYTPLVIAPPLQSPPPPGERSLGPKRIENTRRQRRQRNHLKFFTRR